MNIKIDHIPKGDKRPGRKMVPKYITIHSTANPKSTAQNERDWLVNPSNTRTASWHIAIDDTQAIEAIPLDEVAWHAGDGANGIGNTQSIGIEICESGDREKTLLNAAKLVASMLKERDCGIDRLRRHYDWSKKKCPRILSENSWAGWKLFKEDVTRMLTPEVTVKFNGRTSDIPARIVEGRIEVQLSGHWVQLRDLVNMIPGASIAWDGRIRTASVFIK